MSRRNNIVIGIIFIALGAMFLLNSLNIFNFYFSIFNFAFLIRKFWPALFLILPGIAFHSAFFSGKNRDAGILVPAGILLTIGITAQISMMFGLWHVMWPGFILAVAVGLFELYLFGNRDKGLLIPVAILGTVSLIFFDVFSLRMMLGFRSGKIIISLVLILIGLSIILKNRSRYDDFR